MKSNSPHEVRGQNATERREHRRSRYLPPYRQQAYPANEILHTCNVECCYQVAKKSKKITVSQLRTTPAAYPSEELNRCSDNMILMLTLHHQLTSESCERWKIRATLSQS